MVINIKFIRIILIIIEHKLKITDKNGINFIKLNKK